MFEKDLSNKKFVYGIIFLISQFFIWQTVNMNLFREDIINEHNFLYILFISLMFDLIMLIVLIKTGIWILKE